MCVTTLTDDDNAVGAKWPRNKTHTSWQMTDDKWQTLAPSFRLQIRPE
jgi:hypothetical protein